MVDCVYGDNRKRERNREGEVGSKLDRGELCASVRIQAAGEDRGISAPNLIFRIN